MNDKHLGCEDLLEKYQKRFKEQMKHQRFLLDTMDILCIQNKSQLLNEMHKLCSNAISCVAIAWLSNSCGLSSENLKAKAPEEWRGWTQNSWDWLEDACWKENISSGDNKENCYATLVPLNIESETHPQRFTKTQKEHLLFVLKGPVGSSEAKLREEPILALAKQFSIVRHMEEAYSSFFKSKRDIFTKSLCQGSRTGILDHGRDLLRFAEYLSKDQIDFVKAIIMDAELQLKIVPSVRTTFNIKHINSLERSTNLFEEKSSISRQIEDLLTQLATLRKETWEACQNNMGGNSINEKMNSLKALWRIGAKYKPPEEFSKEIKAEIATLDQKQILRLQKFYYNRMGVIESLRTQLFLLYCHVLEIEGFADDSNITNCDLICFTPITGEKNLFYLVSREISQFLSKWQQKGNNQKSIITSEWLICWFGIRFLEDFPWNTFKNYYSPGERITFLKHFSAFYLYLIHCIRNFGEPSLFRFSDVENGYESYLAAALFVLAEYSHRVCGLSRRIPLYKTLLDTWSSEAILYTVRSSYRDHLHHVLNVTLLGMVIQEAGLDKIICGSETSGTEPVLSVNNRMLNWILAGLLHDVGYCVDLNRHMLSHLAFLKGSPCIKDFHQKLQSFFEESERRLVDSLNKRFDFGEMKEKLDHGVVSAMHLLYLDQVHLGDRAKQKPNIIWMNQISGAFRAMVMHNLKDISIDPQKDPLGFLLLLCDHIQEWDRPRVDSLSLRRFITSELNTPLSASLERNTIVRFLETDLLWNQKTKRMEPISIKDGLKFCLHYKDSGKEKFEPALIWCQNSFDFQSVILENWPSEFQLALKNIHPVCEELKIKKEGIVKIQYSEMDLLQDYLSENGLDTFLSEWIINCRNSNEIIKYSKKDDIEIFELFFKNSLPTAEPQRLILQLPQNFYRDFVNWKIQRLHKAKLHCHSHAA